MMFVVIHQGLAWGEQCIIPATTCSTLDGKSYGSRTILSAICFWSENCQQELTTSTQCYLGVTLTISVAVAEVSD